MYPRYRWLDWYLYRLGMFLWRHPWVTGAVVVFVIAFGWGLLIVAEGARARHAVNKAEAQLTREAEAHRMTQDKLDEQSKLRREAEAELTAEAEAHKKTRAALDKEVKEHQKTRKALANQHLRTIGLAYAAYYANRVDQAKRLVVEFPRDQRHWEWFHLDRLLNAARFSLDGPKGHEAGVGALAYSPNGEFLVTGSGDHTLKLWNARTGAHLGDFPGHGGAVRCLAFSPDGKFVASGGRDSTVKVWDAETRQEALPLPKKGLAHGGEPVSGIAFSPDGALIASGGSDNMVKIWAWKSDKAVKVKVPLEHDSGVSHVAFSHNGRYLASSSYDGKIKIWDAKNAFQLVRPLDAHSAEVYSFAFSPADDLLVSASHDRTARIWTLSDGQKVGELRGHTAAVTSAAFQPKADKVSRDDHLVVTASRDQTLKLWRSKDSKTWDYLRTIRGHTRHVSNVVFAPSGDAFASASFDLTAKIWDLNTDQRPLLLPRFMQSGHKGNVTQIVFSPIVDERILFSAGEDKKVRIWDLMKGEEPTEVIAHQNPLLNLAITRTHVAAGDDKGAIVIYDRRERKQRSTRVHLSAVNGLAFSPDGKWLASAGNDKKVRIWDIAKDSVEEIPLLTRRGKIDVEPHTVAFSPDGRFLAAGGGLREIRVWDMKERKIVDAFSGHENVVVALAFSHNGKFLASTSVDTTVRVWDVESRKEVYPSLDHQGRVNDVAFSPDGKRLASADWDGELKLWDTETGDEVLTLTIAEEESRRRTPINSVAFSADGHLIAAARVDGTIQVWDGTPR